MNNGKVNFVLDMAWKDGEHVDLKKYNGWDEQGSNPKTQQFIYRPGGGVAEWVFNGILVAREVMNYNNPDLDAYVSGRVTPPTRSQSEWWSVVT
jgi:hypothetical protein